MAERIRLFANGEEYRTWKWNNCWRCAKEPACDLEEAVSSAALLDGTIAPEIAARLGYASDPLFWCQEGVERDDDTPPSPAPKPPAHEMTDAGAARLPGLEGG